MINGDEPEGPSPFASAMEVDGIRRTLDMFMKQQEASNKKFQAGIDQILSFINNPPVLPEDKGSNVKGKNIPPSPTPQFTVVPQHKNFAHIHGNHGETSKGPIPQPSTMAMHNTPPDPNMAIHYSHHQPHQPVTEDQRFGQVYYYEETFDPELDWQQHPWNMGEEEAQIFARQQLPNQPHQRPITQDRRRPQGPTRTTTTMLTLISINPTACTCNNNTKL